MKNPYLLIISVITFNNVFSQSFGGFGFNAGLASPIGDRSEFFSEGFNISVWRPIDFRKQGKFLVGIEYSRLPGRTISRYEYKPAALYSLSLGPQYSMPDRLLFFPAVTVNYDGTGIRLGIHLMSSFVVPFQPINKVIIFNVGFDVANLVGKTGNEPSVYFIKLGAGIFFKRSRK